MDEGLPSDLDKTSSAAYLAALAISRTMYFNLLLKKNNFVGTYRPGPGSRENTVLIALTIIILASTSSLLGIDIKCACKVIEWQLESVPHFWHEHLIGLTNALLEEPFEFSLHSNSILAFMRQASAERMEHEIQIDYIQGMMFHTVYLAYVNDAQDRFKRIKSALGR